MVQLSIFLFLSSFKLSSNAFLSDDVDEDDKGKTSLLLKKVQKVTSFKVPVVVLKA